MAAMATAAGAEQMPLTGLLHAMAGGGRPHMAETPGDYRAAPPAAGFTQVGNDAILNRKLHPMARFLLVLLRQHRNGGTGRCCPSYERLRELCGDEAHRASPASLQSWLRALAEAGELAWERDGRSNRYLFPGDPGFDGARLAILEAIPRVLTRRVKAARTTTPSEVVARTTTPSVIQNYSGSNSALLLVKSNHTNLTRRTEQDVPAPTTATQSTERGARAAPSASKIAAANGTPTPPSVQPARGKNVPAPRKRASGEPTNALAAVIDGIRAAGARLVLEAGKDGKAVASVLSGSDVTTADVVACYVAIARGEYGDDFARRNLSISYVCGARCMTGYLVWRESGGKAGGNPAAGRDGGAARTRAAPAARGANPQHLRHAERLDW